MKTDRHLVSDNARLFIFAALIILAIISYINNKMKGVQHERTVYQHSRFVSDFE